MSLLVLWWEQHSSADDHAEVMGELASTQLQLESLATKIDRRNDDVVRRLNSLERALQRHDQELAAQDFYVVRRLVPLSSRKSFSTSTLRLLSVGEHVQAVRRSGKWILVRHLNVETDQVSEGGS